MLLVELVLLHAGLGGLEPNAYLSNLQQGRRLKENRDVLPKSSVTSRL
jgi:hypothetical protein